MKTCPWLFVITACILAGMLIIPTSAADAPAIEWQSVLGSSLDDIPYSISQTADGGYIVAGTTMSGGSGTAGTGYAVPFPGSGVGTTGLGSLLIGAANNVIASTKAQKYTIRVESASAPVASPTLGGGGSLSVNTDILVIKLDPAGNIQWLQVYGSSYDDEASAIRQTSDGGYILAGYTGAGGNRDVLVMRLDASGNVIWQRVMGGSYKDSASDIRQTGDGGYILVGSAYSSNSGDVGANHGSGDVWVIRLDPSGNVVWQKLLGGYGDDNGYSIRQTSEGGYVLTGSTFSSNTGDVGTNHGSDDVWVVKLDNGGSLQWQKVLGGNAHEAGYGIRQTTDGGYVLIGVTGSGSSGDVGPGHGMGDFWVVKLDTAGNIQWQKVLGGSDVDNGKAIEQTTDGGYILTGYSTSSGSGDVGPNHNSCDAWVVKLDSLGNIQWQNPFGGSSVEWGMDIQQTSDGGYVFTGNTESSNSGDVGLNHGRNDFWVVKLAPDAPSLFPASVTTTSQIPSVGQATASYKVGFDGLRYNADGKNTLDLDLAKARRSRATVSVYADRVEIFQRDPEGVLMTFRGTTFMVEGDKVTGPVKSADFVTDPVEAPLTPGMVSGAVRTGFPELTQQGTISTTISDRPAPLLVDQFRSVMAQNGLEFGTVAYTYDVRKSTMPPAESATVFLVLPESWVNQHGGISAVRIIRVSDTTGAAELVPAIYNGTDKKGVMNFQGISANGTSVFGLVTLKATKMVQEKDPSPMIVPMQQPAIMTMVGIFSWLLGSLQQNPGGFIAIVLTACAAYAGRRKGMW
jgi:hypothetical protein